MISRPKQLAVGGYVCVCVCVCACVGVCLHIFFLHMGVIWSFVIPCLHTHTLLVSFCGFLVCVDKVYFGFGQNFGLVFALVQWPRVHSLYLSLSLVADMWHILIYLFNGWMVNWKTFLLTSGHRFDPLQHPVSDWPLSLINVGVPGSNCHFNTGWKYVPEVVSIVGGGGTEVNWGHSWGRLKLAQRPFDVWSHLQSFCLPVCFTGLF